MKKPVVAIGLDSADPLLIETWMDGGHLPTLNKLKQKGTYRRLNNFVQYCDRLTPTCSTEQLWTTFLTSRLPNKTGYWESEKYDENTYKMAHDPINGGYDFQEYLPFYALEKDYKVAIFDVPLAKLLNPFSGWQILGWGGHAPFTPSHSEPGELLPDIIRRYGKNPVLHKDYGYWWDRSYLERIEKAIKVSISRRAEICQDLLKQQEWDLFMTVFGETHSAGHDFWHLSQPDHPLYKSQHKITGGRDPLLESYKAADRAIGEILSAVSEETTVLIFSLHGMVKNTTDMFSMMFLPELLYRYNFPEKVGIAAGKLGKTPPGEILHPKRKSWAGEVWQLKSEPNPVKQLLRQWIPSKFDSLLENNSAFDLISPYKLREKSAPLHWMPAMWYQPLWPQMKAFALPSFANGHIRINLKGREPNGQVDPGEYQAVCDLLTEKLYRIKDARTGKPLVKNIIPTRYSAGDCRPHLPDPDLVIVWQDQPTDVVDSPDFGRIGPVTYYRSGGHRSQGFLIAKGEDIAPNSEPSQPGTVDLPPTILALMGAEIPSDFDGKPLFKTKAVEAVE